MEIVRIIVGNSKNVVVIVGDKLPVADSPVRGHLGTRTHGLFKLLKEHPACKKVIFGSEHRTSKCCCRCGQVLQDGRMDENRHKTHEKQEARNHGMRTQKSRTKVCLVCKPMNLTSILPKMRCPLPTKKFLY